MHVPAEETFEDKSLTLNARCLNLLPRVLVLFRVWHTGEGVVSLRRGNVPDEIPPRAASGAPVKFILIDITTSDSSIDPDSWKLSEPEKVRSAMSLDQRIDALIEAGWHVVESDFDETAVQNWRKQAVECLADLSKPFEIHTEYLDKYVGQAEERAFLGGQDRTHTADEKTKKRFHTFEHLLGNGRHRGT